MIDRRSIAIVVARRRPPSRRVASRRRVAVVGPTPPSPPIVESRTVESRENHEMPSCIFSVGRSRPKP
jgi:hypothetical protein